MGDFGIEYSLKDKNECKADKTGHGNGKSVKDQRQGHEHLIGPTRTQFNGPGCQKPGHLSRSRLGCAKKVATWNDLAFKIINCWNVNT
ncbi:hypothetical protein Tco_0006268 [Tanacetum coccineum]